jgi:hypothetical protein
MARTASADPFITGYKDTPSLADIRNRAKGRAMSVSLSNGAGEAPALPVIAEIKRPSVDGEGDAQTQDGKQNGQRSDEEKAGARESASKAHYKPDAVDRELDEVEAALGISAPEIVVQKESRKAELPLRHAW